MKAPEAESRFDRWWWRCWYVFVALAAAWLTWCAWLSRPIAPWSQGWVGWWTGDASGTRPLWHFQAHPGEGAEIAPVEGDAAFRIGNGTYVRLGHWGEEEETWTWAGWVRVTTPTGTWPNNFVVIRTAKSPSFELDVGFDSGRPQAVLRCHLKDKEAEGFSWYPKTLIGDEALPLGEWIHLAVSSDRNLRRIFVNGARVVEDRGYLQKSIGLASLRLTSDWSQRLSPSRISPRCEIEQDDVVVFDRIVPAEELSALAAQGRGAWSKEINRPGHAGRIRAWTWPVLLSILAGFLVSKRLPRSRQWVARNVGGLMQSPYRAVRWTLGLGIVISASLAMALAEQSRRADEQHFNGLLDAFGQETDSYWENVAALLFRVKDWVSAQTSLNQNAWETWLRANHFPHDYPGVVGIGYAQQVQPEEREAHEARWSEHHGFAYRVHPAPAVPRQPSPELSGQPFLPVVLYAPRALERRAWLTNHSILGRDLLFQSSDDRRSWAEGRRVENAVARNELGTSSLEEIAPAEWYGHPVRGLRMYVPWTLRIKGDDRESLEPSGWRGAVFASVDVRAALQARFEKATPLIGFRVHTAHHNGERIELVADSTELLPGTADRAGARLRRTLEIPFYYRRLSVDLWTTETFEAQSMRRWAWIAGGAGAVCTFLAATLLFVQVRARESQAKVLEALRVANSELLLAYRQREHLSRDLHDGSIQNLYALGLHLQRVQTLLGASSRQAREELGNSLALLDQSIAELRKFILTAGVDHLPQHTVATALEGLVTRLGKTTELKVDLHLDEHTGSLEAAAGVQVLNLVREAVSNALRHAKAQRIEVRLERISSSEPESRESGDHWRLQVIDDGCGFDVKDINGDGRGLKNLAARAVELGGRSEVTSASGLGTRVVVEFPC